MNDPQSPRPNLNHDQEYIRHVKGLLQKRDKQEDIHFEYLTEVFSDLGCDIDLHSTYRSGQEGEIIPRDIVPHLVTRCFEQLYRKELSEELLGKLYRLWDYLAASDPLEPSDLIFVFGGISKQCVEESIRLKKEHYAPKILFSGKKASYMGDVEVAEAEQYKQMAIDSGIAEEDILIEKESVNTPENVINSAKLLHQMSVLPGKVIAVSLPYHMKRASLTMRVGFDWKFQLIRHPGKSAKYTRETYFKDKNGWSYVCFEYMKILWEQQAGHF